MKQPHHSGGRFRALQAAREGCLTLSSALPPPQLRERVAALDKLVAKRDYQIGQLVTALEAKDAALAAAGVNPVEASIAARPE